MKPSRLLVTSLMVTAILLAALGTPSAQPALAAPPAAGPSLPGASAPQAPAAATNGAGKELWRRVPAATSPARQGARPTLSIARRGSYALNRAGMAALLAAAPSQRGQGATGRPLELALPDPRGVFQRFALEESAIMAPGLAARHPEIKTYAGRGIDDPAATIHADLTPLGFHASVRSPGGAWYVEPYYHLDDSVYASNYGRDVTANPHGEFVEREAEGGELSVDRGYYHAADTVTLEGSGFAPGAAITITISEPAGRLPTRSLSATSDELGSFEASFVADPGGILGLRVVEVTDGRVVALTSYEIVRDDDPTVDPPTGDVLRLYRLALITDPGYAAFFGGSANVTAAKVILINRVSQLYEDDLSIKIQLVDDTDKLNLDTYAQAIAPNGPCGTAGCFTLAQVSSCSNLARIRYVVGQIIGASNYDIGHLALGQPGGGVANLGVVGRANKAGGCTGLATPVGDFFAVDYVAHEMGHQFSGNHTFNGNQLNCSGGNRSGATSVEPGSGSSIMAYAGICLTDDLQPHSDPYFSQRSLQEISTYTSSNQPPINEVQTASLRGFGGGNEVQVVTFGPGYAPTATVQPLTVAINAAPSATSRGGAEQVGNTVTIATSVVHRLQVGDTVTISGVAAAGYNGTFTVSAVLNTRSFQYLNPTTGLPVSGGGTVTLAEPGASQSGTTVTIRTAAPHGRAVGDVVTLTGVAVAGYNGTFTITAVPTPRSFEYTAAAGLATSGNGTVTFFSPFQIGIGGATSALIGGPGIPYSNATIQAAINAIPGFAGGATVSAAGTTGFTVTYGGASAGVDLPNLELVSLSCGGCFASVEETNHGGAFDSFQLSYNGVLSAPIVNGANFTNAGILAALTPLLPAGGTASVAGFGGAQQVSNAGFQVTFGGSLLLTNVPPLEPVAFSGGASGFVGETDKGGAVDNKGGVVAETGNFFPAVTVPAPIAIPLRTPFTLTGSATDANGDPMTYIWEQNDRGAAAGTSLLNNIKTNGPLFAMFPRSGQISDSDALLYNSPGQNHITTSPTRVFPDLQQILDNNTNAETGACTPGPIAGQVPVGVKECFAEFLPTADYVGFAGFNASPLALNFRLTARDGRGGVNAADTQVLLATSAGPFLVTSPNASATYKGGSTQMVTWDVAGTAAPPVSTANVRISLSTDGGYTYPYVLSASTPNDGSEPLALPNVGTARGRIKIEAVGNIFFDLSNADFAIQAVPVLTSSLGEGGSQSVQYSDPLSPVVTVAVSDPDTLSSALSVSVTGLPAGLSLTPVTESDGQTLPGSITWKLAGAATGAPGSYPVSVTVTDETGAAGTTAFTIVVGREDASAVYSGASLFWTGSASSTSANVALSATIRDITAVPGDPAYDASPGDIRNARVTFVNRDTNTPFPGCSDLAVGLVSAGDTKTGSASCATTLTASTTTGGTQYSVGLRVDGYYSADNAADVEVITVAQPLKSSFVTGGGYLVLSKSAGLYPGTAGSKANVGFSVKYNRGGTNLQGNVMLIVRSGGRIYQIKSNVISSLAVAGGKANLSGKASIQDITDPANPTPIDGNATLQLWMTDNGEPGTKDTLGVQVLNKSGGTWFSSNWTGTRTSEQSLGGGNLVAR